MAETERSIEFLALSGFTAALHRAVASSSDNVVISPYSVATALGMALAGARGRTAEELCELVGVADIDTGVTLLRRSERRLAEASDPADESIVALANALWVQDGFKINNDYLQVLADELSAEPRQADFGADPAGSAAAINTWVDDRTRGKITDLVDASMLDQLTRLVLVNAAYFKGSWQQPFLGHTRPEPFTRADGVVVQTPMMHQRVDAAGYQCTDDWQAIRLPFRGGRLAMALLLPEPDTSLDRVVGSLDGDLLTGLLGGFDREAVEVALPRWRFRTRQELTPPLQSLGAVTPFDAGAADFTGIADAPLVITDVIHEAFVAVDEQGAEAAAATGVAVAMRAALPREARTIIFDRPFLFVIFETAQQIGLFIGQVTDPTAD